MTCVEHISGTTWHGRKDGPRNAFTYSVDYVLLDAEAAPRAPWLFGRNRRALISLQDSDHGGPPGQGRGAPWVRETLGARGIDPGGRVMLLAQPKVLGYVFNPVSFWLCYDPDGALRVVIAEVTNTFGDRHSYLCHTENGGPIGASDVLVAQKLMHVSPFQPIEGHYEFTFDISVSQIDIRINYVRPGGGMVATLQGARRPMTTGGMLGALLRRPFGARRVMGLIHWQALKLWLKGVRYRPRPTPPSDDVSR